MEQTQLSGEYFIWNVDKQPIVPVPVICIMML